MSKYYPNRCNYNPGVLIMVNFPSHSIVNQVMYVVLLCDEYWHSQYCFRCDRIEKERDLKRLFGVAVERILNRSDSTLLQKQCMIE